MSYLGDFALESTFDTKFCTVTTTGAPTTLAGTPVISAYVDNSTTQLTAGITLTVDFDAVTGLHNVRVVATAANGYAAGSNYQLVITTGTVGGTSVVGYVVAEFSIQARSALRPTVAARTLDVSAGGEAGIDWANIGSPTTAQNLSATNIDVDQVVASVSGAVGSVTAAVTITAASVQAIWDALTSALTVVGSIGKLLVDNLNATITSRLASASYTAPPTVGQIADQVWDEAAADHVAAGSTGEALGAAGGAGDPWITALPGAYGAGTAGKIVGDNLNATVGSRSSHSAADVWAVGARTLTAFSFAVDVSAAAVTLIWDKATSALTTAGSIGKLLVDNVNATISSRSSHAAADVWAVGARTLTAFSFAVDISAAGLAAIWDRLTSALTTVGSVGKLVVDNLNATVSSRSSHSAADVWNSATRTLTSFGALADDVWTSATRTLTTFAADVRAAVGLVAANLDTQLLPVANLPSAVKKNTELANFPLVMVLASDHVSPATGLTVTATRSIDGAAFAACANAVTEIANGAYKITLAAADLNGDTIILRFTAATADARLITILTEP